MLLTMLPLILSLSSLESLSLDGLRVRRSPEEPFISSPVILTRLKSLSIYSDYLHSDALNHLISQLDALEDLNLTWHRPHHDIELKSLTVKRLKLVMSCCEMIISTPSLEFSEFKSEITEFFPEFDWDMPLLKKVVFQFSLVSEDIVPVICEILRGVSHVEELHLGIKESPVQMDPFHALVLTGVDPPIFSSVKLFNLQICFNEYNIEDLGTLLQHFPALESLKLVHKPPVRRGREKKEKKKKVWRSTLPQNAEGHNRHAYFEDLHIAEKKEELLRKKEKLLRKLNRKRSSKRLKT